MEMPVTTATVERSFSDKMIKTRLRNALSASTLELMCPAIEGNATLSEEDRDEILQVWIKIWPFLD